MSHFVVLVIGHDVESQLAPYHEYESTGRDDEHVKNVDRTEDAKSDFETYGKGESFLEFIQGWYGNYPVKTAFETKELARINASRVRQTVPDKWGWIELDEAGEVSRVIQRTNPNAKWDWYVVGGRWTGYFPVRRGRNGVVGSPGLFTEPAEPGKADMVRWGNVDIEKARADAEQKGVELWEKWADATLHSPCPKSWSYYAEEVDSGNLSIEDARDLYGAQPAIKKMRGYSYFGCPVDSLGFDREKYLDSCRKSALVPFAVLKDGEWYERGKMGWWAIVEDEQDEDVWSEKVSELLDGLDSSTWVTAVDCHI